MQDKINTNKDQRLDIACIHCKKTIVIIDCHFSGLLPIYCMLIRIKEIIRKGAVNEILP